MKEFGKTKLHKLTLTAIFGLAAVTPMFLATSDSLDRGINSFSDSVHTVMNKVAHNLNPHVPASQ